MTATNCVAAAERCAASECCASEWRGGRRRRALSARCPIAAETVSLVGQTYAAVSIPGVLEGDDWTVGCEDGTTLTCVALGDGAGTGELLPWPPLHALISMTAMHSQVKRPNHRRIAFTPTLLAYTGPPAMRSVPRPVDIDALALHAGRGG